MNTPSSKGLLLRNILISQTVFPGGHYLLSTLTLKAPSKICSRRHTFYFSKKINLDISYESSAWQMIHMKCQDLFSLEIKKKKKKIECSLLQILLGALRVKLHAFRDGHSHIIAHLFICQFH